MPLKLIADFQALFFVRCPKILKLISCLYIFIV
jgi:hypothetical protein